MSEPRKVVAIATSAAENGFALIVLANDGTVWHRDSTYGRTDGWQLVAALPAASPSPAGTRDAVIEECAKVLESRCRCDVNQPPCGYEEDATILRALKSAHPTPEKREDA